LEIELSTDVKAMVDEAKPKDQVTIRGYLCQLGVFLLAIASQLGL